MKKIKTYNLSVEAIELVDRESKADGRTASNWLNRYLLANLANLANTSKCKQKVADSDSKSKRLDQSTLDPFFDKFWNSGIRKVNKKKAKPIFIKLAKSNPKEFTDKLITDIKQRLNSNQLGFKEMHPTTYLNGERWNDQISTDNSYTLDQLGESWINGE